MKFLSHGIGELVLKELRKASEARLAVAFFNPDNRMLDALAGLPKLKLIVSEEFAFTNPYKLEKLKLDLLRSVSPDDVHGKLHVKVLIIKRPNGSYWTLLGSANLTRSGMFSNQEACVAMEPGNPADEGSEREIRGWFDALFQRARRPDLDQAKLIYDAQSRYRRAPRPVNEAAAETGYWALKTTSGSTGEQHWPMFQAESVVAVGWEALPIDPSRASDAQLRVAIKETYPDDSNMSVSIAVMSIRKFVDLEIDDIVQVCRGYTSMQKKDVHIHGIARVTGPFRAERRRRGPLEIQT
jgi:HKD family nuclease